MQEGAVADPPLTPSVEKPTTQVPDRAHVRSTVESTFQNFKKKADALKPTIQKNEDGTIRDNKQGLEDFVEEQDVTALLSVNPALSPEQAHKQILEKVKTDIVDRMLIKNGQGVFDSRGPSFEKVRSIAKLLNKESYKAVFDELQQKIRNGNYKGENQKVLQKWVQFVQGGDHVVAYDVVNTDEKNVDTGLKGVKVSEIAKSLPGKMAEFAKNAPKSLLEGIKHAVKHPHYLKDAAKTLVKNWDVREWKGRSLSWKLGAVTGALETAFVTWMAPLPGSNNIKSAANFALINGGVLGAEILQGKKAAKIGKEYKAGELNRHEFEERLFKIRSQKSRAEGFLREFGRGLSVGAGLASLDVALLHNTAGVSLTEVGARAAEKILPPMPKDPLGMSGVTEGIKTTGENISQQITKGVEAGSALGKQAESLLPGLPQDINTKVKDLLNTSYEMGRVLSPEVKAQAENLLKSAGQTAEDAQKAVSEYLSIKRAEAAEIPGAVDSLDTIRTKVNEITGQTHTSQGASTEWKAIDQRLATLFDDMKDADFNEKPQVATMAQMSLSGPSESISVIPKVEYSPLVNSLSEAATKRADIQQLLTNQELHAIQMAGFKGEVPQEVSNLYNGLAQETLKKSFNTALIDLQQSNPGLYKKLADVSLDKWPQIMQDMDTVQKKGITALPIGRSLQLAPFVNETSNLNNFVTTIDKNFVEMYSEALNDSKIKEYIKRFVPEALPPQADVVVSSTDSTPSVTASSISSPDIPVPSSVPSAVPETVNATASGSEVTNASEVKVEQPTLNPEQRANVLVERLGRVGAKAADSLFAQPEVKEALNLTVEQHMGNVNEFAQQLAREQGYELTGLPPEQAQKIYDQARDLVRNAAGESFNKALDSALSEINATASNPEFITELNNLKTKDTQGFAARIGELLQTAQENPDSPEGKFLANVNSTAETLYREAYNDMKLRGNLADMIDNTKTAARQAIDKYIRNKEPLPTQQEALTWYAQNRGELPEVNEHTIAGIGRGGEEIIRRAAPVVERVMDDLSKDPDAQAMMHEFMDGRVGDNVDTAGVLVKRILAPYGLTVDDVTPENVQNLIHNTREAVKPLHNSAFEVALNDMASVVDQSRFDEIRALTGNELNRQLYELMHNPDALQNPSEHGINPAVYELATRSKKLFDVAMEDPVVAQYMADQLDRQTEWLSEASRVVRGEEVPVQAPESPTEVGQVEAPVAQPLEVPAPAGTPDTMEQTIESVQGKEVEIKAGDTVSGILARETDLPVRWDSSNARSFGAHLLKNHDLLDEMWNRVESVGLKPERVSTSEVKDLIIAAENGNDEASDALRRLWDSMRFIPAGQRFTALNSADVSTMMEKLGVPVAPEVAKAA